MATVRSYSATVAKLSPVVHFRLNETSGTVNDQVQGLEGVVSGDVERNVAATIGNGAVRFDSADDFVSINGLSGTVRVSAFGDSLIDGEGFQAPGDRYADDLQEALNGLGLNATVFDHGNNGDTVEEGRARVDDVLEQNPDVVIVEFGTNDAIQENGLSNVESDLRGLVNDLQTGGVEQILLTGAFGFYPERNGGVGYDSEDDRDAFEAMFAQIAADETGVTLLQDAAGSDKFLGGSREGEEITGGVLGNDNLNDDGLHPNAAGVDQIVTRTLPQTVALGAAAGAVNEPLLLAEGAFETWINPADVSGDHIVLSKNAQGEGTGGHMALGIRDGRARFVLGDETGDNFVAQSADAVIVADRSAHLLATFGAAGMKVYVDGELVAENAYTGGLDAGLGNFEPLVIGGDTGNNQALTPVEGVIAPFTGTIDEVVVYDQPLNAQQIADLHAAGLGGTTLVGTAGNDLLVGGVDAEILRGQDGDDVLGGGAGNDRLAGNRGADDLLGQAGNDFLAGHEGNDLLMAGPGRDTLYGGQGTDTMFGGPGNDFLSGGPGRDQMTGQGGDDILRGGQHADVLNGNAGNDELFGGQGGDRLIGQAGNDLLDGGQGLDTLIGGNDSDTFRLSALEHGLDRVIGFESGPGGDVLDIAAVLEGFDGGSTVGDFVRLNETNGNTRVQVDANGAGGDFENAFHLVGSTGLDLDQLVADGNLNLTNPVA